MLLFYYFSWIGLSPCGSPQKKTSANLPQLPLSYPTPFHPPKKVTALDSAPWRSRIRLANRQTTPPPRWSWSDIPRFQGGHLLVINGAINITPPHKPKIVVWILLGCYFTPKKNWSYGARLWMLGSIDSKRTAEYNILYLCKPYELVGGFNPFENYVRQIGSIPQVVVNILVQICFTLLGTNISYARWHYWVDDFPFP